MQIAIVGAGLLGRILAFKLSMQGNKITLFDKGDISGKQSCGWVAAGMLAPFSELENSPEIIYKLGILAIRKWPQYLNQLNSSQIFSKHGSLVVSLKKDVAELKKLYEKVSNKHFINNSNILNNNQINEIEPELTKFWGLHFPEEGHIDTEKLFSVLTKYLMKNTTWHTHSKVNKCMPKIIEISNKTFKYDLVIDARGLGSKTDYKHLRGVRGELIIVKTKDVKIKRPIRLFQPRRKIYIVPRDDNLFVIGASSIEAEDFSPISVQSTLEFLTTAFCLQDSFAEARIIDCRVQCRPAFTNNLPLISCQPGLIKVNGLYRHGYLLTPAIVEDINCYINKGINQVLHTKEFWRCHD